MKNTFIDEKTIEHQFISFCKAVLCNELRNIYAQEKRWLEKFISIDELTDMQMNSLSTYDRYETEYEIFHTHGHTIPIEDALLAEAVAYLPKKQQDVILLSFFLDRNEREIAILMGITQSTLHYHKTKALESLYQILTEVKLK